MAARKLPKKRLVKYVNIKIGHRFFGTHHVSVSAPQTTIILTAV